MNVFKEISIFCIKCNSKKTGTAGWYKISTNTYECNKCYMKEYRKNKGQFKNFKEEFNKRICSECKSSKTQVTITKKGYPHTKWVSDQKGGYLCHKCAKRTKYKTYTDNYNKNKVQYKDKFVLLDYNPKTGNCSWCKNNIYNGTCKRTQIHHFSYHDSNALKDTIELCPSCHRKITAQEMREEKIFTDFLIKYLSNEVKRLQDEIFYLKNNQFSTTPTITLI